MAKHASVDQQREWYHSDLEASIGPRFTDATVATERVGIIAALTTPAALLFLVLLAFCATLGTLLWRDGKLDGALAVAKQRIITNSGYAPKPASKPWVLGSDNSGVTTQEVPAEAPPATPEQPNEMEAAIQAAQRLAEPEPPVETPGID